MLEHQPEVLINGGDVGLTSEVLAQYAQTMERVSVPVLLSHGNHEMCSGYLPREQGGTAHASADIGGVHFVLLDVVRYFEPTEESSVQLARLGRRGAVGMAGRGFGGAGPGRSTGGGQPCAGIDDFSPALRGRRRTWPFPPMRLLGRGAC